MSSDLFVDSSLSKEAKYLALLPQIYALTNGEKDVIANLGNVCSALKYGMSFFWVGFYLLRQDELVLGPFQGTPACTRIPLGKGVCGQCARQQILINVPDVDAFPGHIACSQMSKSEIVLPVFTRQNELSMVLDIDSDLPACFDKTDEFYLQQLTAHISTWL